MRAAELLFVIVLALVLQACGSAPARILPPRTIDQIHTVEIPVTVTIDVRMTERVYPPDLPQTRRLTCDDAYWRSIELERLLSEANRRLWCVQTVYGPDPKSLPECSSQD